METAAILSGGKPLDSDDLLRENERSATQFVGPEKFAALFDAMYAHPDVSAAGWETASTTQQRVIAAVTAALGNQSLTTIFVGHGSAGTFLKCHVAGRPIARHEDQRTKAWPGGGNVFAFDWTARRLLTDWLSFEDFTLPAS